jgi:hypothetical protein
MEPRGIEPLTDSVQPAQTQDIIANSAEPLANSLARESQIDPALARIIDAWPTLPTAIRRALMALAESGE